MFNEQDALYGYSVAEFVRRQSLDKRAKERTAAVTALPSFPHCLFLLVVDSVGQGEWGTTAADQDPVVPDIDVAEIRKTLATLQREFQALIRILLTDLAFQGDTEMRFLGIRLNYNEVCSSPKPPHV